MVLTHLLLLLGEVDAELSFCLLIAMCYGFLMDLGEFLEVLLRGFDHWLWFFEAELLAGLLSVLVLFV